MQDFGAFGVGVVVQDVAHVVDLGAFSGVSLVLDSRLVVLLGGDIPLTGCGVQKS